MVACDKCLSPDKCAMTAICIATYIEYKETFRHKFPKDEQISNDSDELDDGGGDDNEINNYGMML